MIKEDVIIRRRKWKIYSASNLMEQISQVVWRTEIDGVQELWNSIEQEIMTVTDRVAPFEEVGIAITRKESAVLKKQQNRRNYLLRKRKRKDLTLSEKDETKNLL